MESEFNFQSESIVLQEQQQSESPLTLHGPEVKVFPPPVPQTCEMVVMQSTAKPQLQVREQHGPYPRVSL